MLRLGTIAIVLLPVLLGVVLHHVAWIPWTGAGLALVGGVVLTLARPRARGLVLLGTMLAVLAGLASPQLPAQLQPPTHLDLRTDSVPTDLRGAVIVTGYLRDEHSMAEFAVPEGALPRQDAPPEALLVPLHGAPDGPVPLRDVVLVARVRPGQERIAGPQTLHGHARPLEPELLSAFVQASGLTPAPGVQGILVDVALEPRTPGWLLAGLVVLAMLGAAVCLLLATRGTALPPE